MDLRFEWDSAKADSNARKHGVSFQEASTVFGDPLSFTLPDPDHSGAEDRFLLLGRSETGRVLVVTHTERRDVIRIINAGPLRAANGGTMKKTPDHDAAGEMRPEYDFRGTRVRLEVEEWQLVAC